MEKAKVYFTNMRTSASVGLPQKLRKLILAAGIGDIDFEDKFVAIKLHFGELGNLAFLRPNYAKVVADVVKEKGGKPFVTDCNTLYVGSRKNALDHLETAYQNGFSPFSTGCHVIIADGLKGTDDVEVPVEGAEYSPKALIGRGIMDADVFISLTHFKGHECTGFGGAIKNIGMGCGSRAGKMDMHNNEKPTVDHERCVGCGICTKFCAQDAIYLKDRKANIDHDKCLSCGHCIGACNKDAICPGENGSLDVLQKKMAEYTKAVVHGRPCFHISLIVDVSPFCDCYASNDLPIIPNVGMLASFDPVALDVACADLCNKQNPNRGSLLEGKEGHDHFHALFPETRWETGVEHAEKLGIGTRQYELIEV